MQALRERAVAAPLKERATMKKFDFCVFIGRFSPFHNAHKSILGKGIENCQQGQFLLLAAAVLHERSAILGHLKSA